MLTSNYEYIPREIEVEELQYVPTSDYLFFTTGYYKKVKVKKTIYDKYKKITYPTKIDYDLIKVTDAKKGELVQIGEYEGKKLFEIK